MSTTSDWSSYCMCVWLTHMNRTLEEQIGLLIMSALLSKFDIGVTISRTLFCIEMRQGVCTNVWEEIVLCSDYKKKLLQLSSINGEYCSRSKWDQKVWKLFSTTLKVVYKCVCSRTDMSVQNGCARSNRMDVSARRQPVSIKCMCLLGERMCLVRTVAPVPTEQMCLFGMVVPILIKWMCLLRKASSKFLYKGQNSTPKRKTSENSKTQSTIMNKLSSLKRIL